MIYGTAFDGEDTVLPLELLGLALPLGSGPLGVGGISGGDSERQTEMEARPRTEPAFHVQASAHELDQSFGDRQPEAGSAVTPGSRGVCLRERFEDRFELVFGNPDSGVGDGEPDVRNIIRPVREDALDVDTKMYFAAGRSKFRRVAAEIKKNLAQPGFVADESLGHIVGDDT